VPRSIEAFVADAIDLANATTARILASRRAELPGSDLFVTGGRLITRDDVVNAAARRDIGALARRVRARRLASAIDVALSSDSRRLEEEILAARIADARERTREDALDAGVIVLFLLRLRAEQERIVRAAWSCELGLRPRPVREPRVAA
jgi:vacuolar-type H+-ATPase subunit C/Vma6